MEIWRPPASNTASTPAGSAARSIPEAAEVGGDIPGLHVGTVAEPLAFKAKKTEVPSATTPESSTGSNPGGDVASKREAHDAQRVAG